MTQTTRETAAQAKARGAFYTPPEITAFLARWVVRSPNDRALEPSCGDGAFVSALAEQLSRLGASTLAGRVVAIERDEREAQTVRDLAPGASVTTADFFDVDPDAVGPVDGVIGNPPFIRYHGFAGSVRDKALARARAVGADLTNLASSWAYFVAHSLAFMNADGRLGMVLPAELLHTDYAQPVRDLLARRFTSLVVVAFDRQVFPAAQVDAVLLLASNDDQHGLRVIRLADEHALGGALLSPVGPPSSVTPLRRWNGLVHPGAAAIYDTLQRSGATIPLGALASVDIGFVSGANDFFVLSSAQASAHKIPSWALTPAVRRPGDVPGLVAKPEDAHRLLCLAKGADVSDPGLSAYLNEGVTLGIPDRYKCRVRRPWYSVPLPRARPDAFIPYMNHRGPRLIVNDSGALSSNLLHGVTLGLLAPPARALSAAMTSTATLLSAEIEGRSYGGGVLKLETKEAERLLVPRLDAAQAEVLVDRFAELHVAVLAGDTRAAARRTDAILGLDHEILWSAYVAFTSRRLGRRRAQAA